MNLPLDLQHALRLADEADKITKQPYRSQELVITDKPDTTPVTNADLAVEERLSQIVSQEFHENYLGEEGTRQGSAGRLWIVDPIDGTKNFLRAMPIWATLIALTENGQALTAVVSAPALGRRWWASKDGGAWTQDVNGTTR